MVASSVRTAVPDEPVATLVEEAASGPVMVKEMAPPVTEAPEGSVKVAVRLTGVPSSDPGAEEARVRVYWPVKETMAVAIPEAPDAVAVTWSVPEVPLFT